MKENYYIITGGNSGLGLETAKRLAAKGCKIILACRDPRKADAAKKEVIFASGNDQIETMLLDLASLDSVREFAKKIKARGITLAGLDCNAGVAGFNNGEVSADGYDLVFATNYLGHFLLTLLLLPCMKEDGRIIIISSEVHNPPKETLIWPGVDALAKGNVAPKDRYRMSKLCDLYFTYELDRRLRKKGSKVTVNAFNPGALPETNLGGRKKTPAEIEERRNAPGMDYWLGDLGQSGQAVADLLTKVEFEGTSALYYDRSTKSIPSSTLSYDKENALSLWNASLRMCGLDLSQY